MNLCEWKSNSKELIYLIPDKLQTKDQKHVDSLSLM